ncbi:cell division protein FtsI [Companilactobacillus sp. RD055328]|uniref:penicillin-binding transpeptidase domain-containing protein n=1 Tax=Companilactobacillus sp. RD055328 TaxID=2916634 RepID=UPI001FC83C0B|nr:penicillin-binding transpeptidase domain-containing protein [Companilactobacillus sp. RD055328]GKQ42852.1 cell division protein FtsI [Companilactobacillus sp. RD055328]
MSNNKKSKNSRAKQNRKLFARILTVIFALVFFVFIFDFARIAITGQAKGENLDYRTKFKYTKKSSLVAKRGNIYDDNGDVVAADAGEFSIYAILDKQNKDKNGKDNYVVDKNKTAQVLSKYLSLSENEIKKYLTPNKKVFQVEFGTAGKNLSLHVKDQIEKEKLPGIAFEKTPSRSYPNGVFATNLVGITKISNKEDVNDTQKIEGIMGVEQYFNKTLKGTDGEKISKVDSRGAELPETKVVTKQSQNGSDVYLTLDTKMQDYLEILMSQIQTNYQPLQLQAVVMDSKSGAIKAMSQRPTFNPTTLAGINNSWRNTQVEDQFEPGSVMKILTLSASIDSGNYDPDGFYNSGKIEVADRTISDWNGRGWGTIPFNQAFPRSSNVGMVNLEQQMGADTWDKYLKKFHLAKKTGIELPNESTGKIQFENKSDQAMTSFGQSINVNNMQMLQAVSAIANDGEMVKPYIVDKIYNPNTGKTKKTKKENVGQPISKKTAKQVLSAMEDVVYKKYGSGQSYQIPGYKLGVKTGTAQIASPNGGYLTGNSNYIFSVMGILPSDNPKYLVYITMKQPQNMTKPAETILSEIFNPLALRLMKSDTTIEAENQNISDNQIHVPNLIGQSLDDAKKKLSDNSLTPVVIGTGSEVVQQLPRANEMMLKDQKVVLMTNGAMTMPDITGWSKSDVLKLSEITGKKIKISGSGYVVSQSVAEGTSLTETKEINVNLKDK